MGLTIDSVIYFYIFICIALLVFNVGYIFRSKRRSRRQYLRSKQWSRLLQSKWETRRGTPAHQNVLRKKLKNVDELMAFQEAIAPFLGSDVTQRYLDRHHDVFQELAVIYRRRSAMERAFFAYLIALYHPDQGRKHDQLAELLLDFLENSTVYCRENVLLALCALGNSGAVEHALQLFQEQEWYHHPRLISDGLISFAGDREALARRLWALCGTWEEYLQVAVVQFATNLSGNFAPEFAAVLQKNNTPTETRFALIRYFQRWPADIAKPILIQIAEASDAGGVAISACAALGKYPGTDTMQVLKQSLRSRNWHVRRNAATSLLALGLTKQEFQEILESGDRYAREMLTYMAQLQNNKGVTV